MHGDIPDNCVEFTKYPIDFSVSFVVDLVCNVGGGGGMRNLISPLMHNTYRLEAF